MDAAVAALRQHMLAYRQQKLHVLHRFTPLGITQLLFSTVARERQCRQHQYQNGNANKTSINKIVMGFYSECLGCGDKLDNTSCQLSQVRRGVCATRRLYGWSYNTCCHCG
jgi:hypothetical protein